MTTDANAKRITVALGQAPWFNRPLIRSSTQGFEMSKHALGALVAFILSTSVIAHAQSSKRTELTKGDLTGTEMEIFVGTVEGPPTGVLHIHAGEEAYYVLDGASALLPDGKTINFEPGTAKINVRD